MRRLRSYLIIFLIFALLPIAAVVGVNAIGFIGYRQTASGSDIVAIRQAKLDASDEIELLMLGDSSLNAAIDDDLFSSLSGYRTTSLPLTGQWGYAGSLAILERVLERRSPSIVLFMHTTDMFGRNVADLGYFLASERRWAATFADGELASALVDNLTSTKNFEKWSETWEKRWFGEDPAKAAKRQARSRRSIRDDLHGDADIERFVRKKMELGAVNQAKIKYLTRLAAVCEAKALRCLYAHGPMARPLLEPVQAFLENVNPIITSLDFTLLPFTPVPMEYQDIGNTEDHVARERKEAFTRRFAAHIAPYLDTERPKGDEEADRLRLSNR